MGARSRGDALLALQRQVTALTQQVNDLQWLVAESHRQQQLLLRDCRETTVAAVRECMSQLPVLLERAMAQAVSSGQLGLPAEPASVDSGVPSTDARDAGRPRSPSPQPLTHGAPAHVALMTGVSATDADACRGSASAHVALTVNDAPLARMLAAGRPRWPLSGRWPPDDRPRRSHVKGLPPPCCPRRRRAWLRGTGPTVRPVGFAVDQTLVQRSLATQARRRHVGRRIWDRLCAAF